MAVKRIILKRTDYEKLTGVLDAMKRNNRPFQKHMNVLNSELKNALIMEDGNPLLDRVSLYSKVYYTNLNDQSSREATLVFPAQKDISNNRISILTPLGTALIGEQEQGVTVCHAPGGDIPLRIDKVYPPEESS